MVALICFHSELLTVRPRLLRYEIADGDELGTRRLDDGTAMMAGNPSTSDDANANLGAAHDVIPTALWIICTTCDMIG
jgi:hypothetical protein